MSAGVHGTVMPRTIPGLTAGVTQASNQYKAMKWASTANAVIACAATTDICIGILLNNPAAGETALVADDGIVPCLAGANNIAAGNNLGQNSTGQLAAHTTDNRMSMGKALEASTAVGDIILVQLYGGGSVRY